MSVPEDLFPGFATRYVKTAGADIFMRIGGSGPPLLCLHGFPQTHVCWHRIAPVLAQYCTVVAMDLRGYGESSAPRGDSNHWVYSKRAMVEDCIAAMNNLGFRRFVVMGHDRGARVAYRLALDRPETVDRLVLLDILPTAEVWARLTAESARTSYHWQFLSQPRLLPETLIGEAPAYYVEHTLASWTKDKTLDCFAPEALRHYRALLSVPERIHAVCEDYRAGATVDRAADLADLQAGRKIACPTLVLWGSDYVGKGSAHPLEVWRTWCSHVVGGEIVSGHFLVEENPQSTLDALMPFLTAS
ncbi:MAG: alpha/beta fold hydrolase [Hyphomicrobiaceae bacterium]